ncbi:MAG: phosphoglycolate phosphatase [Gammaproteobacteria bacterium]|nr:MAG: phosphoglycolate phosphatase [Gammaproteobacteria bacterium]
MPKNKIQAVLFDMDGTLVDTAPDMADTLNLLLKKNNLTKLDQKIIRPFVSQGAMALIKLAFQSCSIKKQETLKDEYLTMYQDNFTNKSALFEGTNKILSYLDKNNIKWGIVTNKPHGFAKPLLEHLKIYKNCAVLVCGDSLAKNKPHPLPLKIAAQKINIDVKKCIYIGDDIRDMQAAIAAKMPCAVAKWGYIDKQEDASKWHGDYIFSSIDELMQLL